MREAEVEPPRAVSLRLPGATAAARPAAAGNAGCFPWPYGRPSIPPAFSLRAWLLQVFYSTCSERQLMEQRGYNLLFRWFVGLGTDDVVWVYTVFSKNRDRLLDHGTVQEFFHPVLERARGQDPCSKEHFSVDGTLLSPGFAGVLPAQRSRGPGWRWFGFLRWKAQHPPRRLRDAHPRSAADRVYSRLDEDRGRDAQHPILSFDWASLRFSLRVAAYNREMARLGVL